MKLSKITTLDFQQLMLGKELGRGIARRVFEFLPDHDYVVKIEDIGGSFQNVTEWEFWQRNRDFKEVSKWLAPLKAISPSGTVLIQRRITPITAAQMPEKIPQWMNDVKLDHFGKVDGKIVVCDYAYTSRSVSTRLVKNWAKK